MRLVSIENLFGVTGLECLVSDSHIGRDIERDENHGFEPKVREVLDKFLEPEWTFIDVGAHCGVFSVYANHLMKDMGKIFAFEPKRDMWRVLKMNLCTQVEDYMVFQTACGAISGDMDLFCNPSNDGDNRIVNTVPEWERETVRCVRLDEMADYKSPVFLKIDAQWAEGLVLEGMSEQFHKVQAGVVEVQQYTRAGVTQFLKDHLCEVDDFGTDIAFWRA